MDVQADRPHHDLRRLKARYSDGPDQAARQQAMHNPFRADITVRLATRMQASGK